jgi:hypothetical protein
MDQNQKTVKIISLGAGVQSTTLLLMAARGEFGEDFPRLAVFADTGWEPPHVYAHLDWLEEEVGKYGIRIIRASSGNLREDFLDSLKGRRKRAASIPMYVMKEGAKREGMLWRQCTREYKIMTVRRAIRQALGYGPTGRVREKIELWMGISTDEIQRVKPSQVKFIENKYPLIDRNISRDQCVEWMRSNGYPEPPKSACIGCPYHDDAYWLDMKENFPEDFADAVSFEKEARENSKNLAGKVYLHRSCVPLDQVQFKPGDKDRGEGFGNECEGMCGI